MFFKLISRVEVDGTNFKLQQEANLLTLIGCLKKADFITNDKRQFKTQERLAVTSCPAEYKHDCTFNSTLQKISPKHKHKETENQKEQKNLSYN